MGGEHAGFITGGLEGVRTSKMVGVTCVAMSSPRDMTAREVVAEERGDPNQLIL